MLLWFRNDLRTHDNPALHYFLSVQHAKKPGKAVFFISKKQWQQHHWSAIKMDLIIRHASALVDELATLGIELTLVHLDTFSDQVQYIISAAQKDGIDEVVANSEVEFNEQQRDWTIAQAGVNLRLFEADVIVPKGRILNQAGQMFKVFTPFKRAWLKHLNQQGFEYLGKTQSTAMPTSLLASDSSNVDSLSEGQSNAWPLAPTVEQTVMPTFFNDKLANYSAQRDIPSVKGTSGLSPYLAAGLISPRYVLMQLLNTDPDILSAPDSANFAWLNELIWREFYRHLLFHEPRLCKHQSFNQKYQHTQWHNNAAHFQAWKCGRTGYPLVDAAMRQLNQTGWMHNRLRMVVASFLTKHLLIDWRWGEQYFMEQLIDGDLAANNGGWQWAASTGCDAQPYFRIFNPIRQSERFDPNGDFIRMYLPELKDIPNKAIHFPHAYLEKYNLTAYWPAIVEHKEARLNALAFYK
ncbi:deoxyribodipyrimidine photo-lyase [Psychrobium sp. 1_MG-2023]|uniref:deoxyribodipyrimidine photo-lyase n=1 Tax=Psychrobium sp. 1_MG-2023 TaxID=3062624 RepID=UPI000C337F8C|nr:deoxyribodipyrimidine photo-lyase [Psychrobium sp. 1_MG-2023]MDP2562156.1 deoxyribodipyrimidine photo-lyase [Psychrobium sp. 1_MG-2023]PKF57172.1 deoxyribodipyrimidine photo-lyase [Alteromonadales bacterium alter-6D02]